VLFSNRTAVDATPSPVARRVVAVRGCRSVRSTDLVRNGRVGEVRVAADGTVVTWEGGPLTMDPVQSVPVSRLHFW